MKIGKKILLVFIGVTLLSSCSSNPDGVLPQEKMAELLADIHIGESVVEVERTKFYSDSLKKTVKQSILIKHDVTQEELDSSFAWYGRNIEEYIAVYNRVIEILDNDINELGSGTQEKIATIPNDGDSTNCWQGANRYIINANSASQYITFSLPQNANTEKGDFYTWHIKLINNISPIKWGIIADYADGSSEYLNATAINEGWNNIKLIPDSTKMVNKIYGYIFVNPKGSEQVYIDSISLIKMHVNRNIYRQRAYQKKFNYKKGSEKTDNNKKPIDNKKPIGGDQKSIGEEKPINDAPNDSPNKKNQLLENRQSGRIKLKTN